MIIFKNGKQLETTAVYGGTETYQSAQRKTLELMIPADALTLDEAKAIWQDRNATSEITVEAAQLYTACIADAESDGRRGRYSHETGAEVRYGDNAGAAQRRYIGA